MRETVNQQSRAGHIVWRDWFPDSSRAEVDEATPTFKQMSDQWLRHRSVDVKPSTHKGYTKRIKYFWNVAFGHMPINAIRKSHVKDALIVIGWTSGKTMSNSLTPLRGVFDLAIDDDLIVKNPANGIKIPKTQRKPCNPCTQTEMHAIIDALEKSVYQNYFRVAFGTGMRVSELIGLKWSDVNLKRKTVRVHSARTDGQDTGTTKTARERTIALNGMALGGLKMQRWQSKGAEHVFRQMDGQPVLSDQPPRRAWQRALAKCDIQPRRAYETRSTFATLHLMGGMELLEVSHLLGHKNPSMTLDHYSAWMKNHEPVDLAVAFG